MCVQVHRRTHQYMEVPAIPNQRQYQCWSNFEIEERNGGYQDRSGKKNEKYDASATIHLQYLLVDVHHS
jgi:hypothetical protein